MEGLGDASNNGNTTIEIFDVLGRIVYYNSLSMGENLNSIDISEVEKFEAGNYFLTIRTADETFNFNLVKVNN